MQGIADSVRLTRARVQQILATHGVDVEEARAARRALQRSADADQLAEFWDEHGDTVVALSSEGRSKQDVVARFGYLFPALDPGLVQRALDRSRLAFAQRTGPHYFSDEALEWGVWYVVGLSLELTADPGAAILGLDVHAASEVTAALRERRVEDEAIASILAIAVQAKEQAATSATSLSGTAYTQLRQGLVRSQDTRHVSHAWPADAQTVMSRLGGGYWTNAVQSLGLQPNERGRGRGTLLFLSDDYELALRQYVADRTELGQRISFRDYDVWRQREKEAGRTRPAAISIRKRMGTWAAALQSIQGSPEQLPDERLPASPARIGSRMLHATRKDMREKLAEVQASASVTTRDPAVRSALLRYASAFEKDRRRWVRAMILADPGSLERRTSPGAPPLRGLNNDLMARPPRVARALTDRYLDGLLSNGGLTNTDGWLSPAVQAELDTLNGRPAAVYELLRATRNLIEHESGSSRDRVRKALTACAEVDPVFQFRQDVTEVNVVRWLGARRRGVLQHLMAVMPEICEAMVAAESVLHDEADAV